MKGIKICLLLMTLFLLCACGTKQQEQDTTEKLTDKQIYLYLPDADRTGLYKKVVELDKDKPTEQQVEAVMEQFALLKATEEYQSPIPGGILYQGNHLEERRGRLEISFQIDYDAVDADQLLFFKVCLTKTLLQLQRVGTVAMSFKDLANPDEEAAPVVENFDQDSFLLSFGKDSSYKQSGNIVLYFAGETGEGLKEYRKTIEISNNSSLARIVVDSLIAGPEKEGYQATLPDKTTIRNISVKDGICYVDLSDEFYSTDNSLKNDVIVYSVVNSLVELPTISKVQFLKNGEKIQFFRETLPFDSFFERNLDLIEQEETRE